MGVTSRASRTPNSASSLDGTLGDERDAFARYLARQRSAKTAETYLSSIDQFHRFLADMGMPLDVEYITREHIESWIEHLQARVSPATVSVRYRALESSPGQAETLPLDR